MFFVCVVDCFDGYGSGVVVGVDVCSCGFRVKPYIGVAFGESACFSRVISMKMLLYVSVFRYSSMLCC